MPTLEKRYRAEKIVSFVIHYGKANGSAWWDPKLKWENLTEPQFKRLATELKNNGVKVIAINFTAMEPSYEG